MATRKKTKEPVSTEPVVVVGTHLTVTIWPDGRTELKWDDAALLSEVRNAILKHESTMAVDNVKPAVKAKTARNKRVKETK
jgi:hypothetical protein